MQVYLSLKKDYTEKDYTEKDSTDLKKDSTDWVPDPLLIFSLGQ